MESRLIYESSKSLISKIKWNRESNSDSEWRYFDNNNTEFILEQINSFFTSELLHVSIGRQDSFTVSKNLISNKIVHLFGQQDLFIWNNHFTESFEISKIGVYRTGIASS
jgi:hypothetical protein